MWNTKADIASWISKHINMLEAVVLILESDWTLFNFKNGPGSPMRSRNFNLTSNLGKI